MRNRAFSWAVNRNVTGSRPLEAMVERAYLGRLCEGVRKSTSQQVASYCSCPRIDNRDLAGSPYVWVDGGCPIHGDLQVAAAVLYILSQYGPCMYSQIRSRVPIGTNHQLEATVQVLCRQGQLVVHLVPGPYPRVLLYELPHPVEDIDGDMGPWPD